MRPSHALVPTLVLALACGSGSRAPGSVAPAPAATAPDSAPRLRIPRMIAGFRFAGRQDYDDPDLGMSVRYRHSDSLSADLYFYPGPDLASGCDVACAADLLRSEIDTSMAAMQHLQREGRLRSVRIARARDLAPARGDAWRLGHRAEMRLVVPGSDVEQRSEFWLVYVPGTRVKVRATFVETPARLAALEGFLAAVMPTVTSPEPPRVERPLPAATDADAVFSLLEGTWDWELSNGECERGMHTLVPSADRQTIRLRIDGEPDSSDAHSTYRVLAVGTNLLPGATHVLRLALEGEERRADDGTLVQWHLVFRSRDRYHWHRSDWPPDGATGAVIRCDAPGRR